jgi:DNA-directed RNA polymerase subunit M/transcription elongation factor TFIIS
MEFCPECGSMLLPTEDNELKCSCGYTKKLSKDKLEYNFNEKIKENDSVYVCFKKIQLNFNAIKMILNKKYP